MHALIIEDEPLIACQIEDVLRDHGFVTIDFAETFSRAVAQAAKRAPDLITADVNLAEGSGIDAVEAITTLIAPRVVFVTASVADVRHRLPQATVVPKPFSAAALRRAIVAHQR
jgi:DNA-binding response OmpR family regulator